MFQQAAAESGQSVEGMVEYTTLDVAVWKSGGNMVIANPEDEQPEGTLCVLEILTLEEYNRVAKEPGQLQDDEIFVCVRQGEAGDTSYSLNGKNLRIKEYLEDFQLEGMDKMIIYDGYFLVVKDRQVMQELYEMQKAVYGERASVETYSIFADLSGDPGQMERYEERFLGLLEEYNQTKGEGETIAAKLALKDERREAMMVFCGGFLFLGVFLGFVFLMATVLIIYYKQVSEGYEDKGRFEIMRKVGMSPKEVKASIHSQIMKVFFLPLVMAGVHLTMAFPMMNRLLMLFNLRNPGLFAACTVVVVCIFAGIYGIVFGITAKAYYQIVGEQR